MPWTLNDYPSSMKNLDKIVRKKAIDIANSMVDEGYDEGRAIPIATEQAKEWYNNAEKGVVKEYADEGSPAERSAEGRKYDGNPERLLEGEHVVAHENGWAVKSSNAKKPAAVFETKGEAVKRAREIARNKGTKLTVFKLDGSVQEQQSY
ncbi:DUF2188 domain-containing protein [Virgibacillus oceani]|uniref:DUF2188 domain-containing protein n=1 Tax=Virgibacillus oceani TaxID=1479511 RepID=A0A917HJV9_9BACI|nr:DUF2188 domain-containing protein [Virgibacillus oceani]GGG81425.1 hypothetical protein GCM10011398_28600 [Virgibacillus oceani]